MGTDVLILGAGWTSQFLIQLCDKHQLKWAATTRTGRDGTIVFEYDQSSNDPERFKALPDAKTVLVTFPITQEGASARLVRLYGQTRNDILAANGGESDASVPATRFIQLGTTSIWGGSPRGVKRATQDTQAGTTAPSSASGDNDTRNTNTRTAPTNASSPSSARQRQVSFTRYDRHSPYTASERSKAEDELLGLATAEGGVRTTVLNLSGLWGGSRDPKAWLARALPTKEILRTKGSLHLIHGQDIARAIISVHTHFDKANGQRWLLTDGKCHDWWELAAAWGSEDDPQPTWVRELMEEEGIETLPRSVELLGRVLDSKEFWTTFGLKPEVVVPVDAGASGAGAETDSESLLQ